MEIGAAILQELPKLGQVAFQTFVLYLFLIVVLRLLGRRQISELSVTELVIVMVLGSAVETALIAGDTSLPAGLTSAVTLLLSNRLFSLLLARWAGLRRVFVGRPIPLVYQGRVLAARLPDAGLTEDNVRQGCRERGYDDLEQVRLAVLEMDGTISVVPNDTSPPARQGPSSGESAASPPD